MVSQDLWGKELYRSFVQLNFWKFKKQFTSAFQINANPIKNYSQNFSKVKQGWNVDLL